MRQSLTLPLFRHSRQTACRCFAQAILVGLLLGGAGVTGAEADALLAEALTGRWVINDALSQNTDEQVEAAIKAAGGKVPRRWFGGRQEDRYRGGPPEHELYDRLSYDDVLSIEWHAPQFRFVYEDGYERTFFTDGRRQTTGVSDYFRNGGEDPSFGEFADQALLVEARPRDGGFTEERYVLEADGARLRIEMTLQPDNFGAPVRLIRIFDRAP